MKLYHHNGFAAPIGQHVMPMKKFALVAEALRGTPGVEILEPEPVTRDDLLRVHDEEYIDAVATGEPRELAESQKFPWSPALYSSVMLTSGGVLAAARSALSDGISGALASGFHHASRSRGEGFCTFNGLVVAAEALRHEGLIRTVAVLDLDLHYGNGTARLATSRPWLQALSIYGNDYWDNVTYRDVGLRRHQDGPNHFSVPILPRGAEDGSHLLALLDEHLPWLIRSGAPDLLLFQAGVDPLSSDPYSPLQLSAADLRARDEMVFRFAKKFSLPVAWVLAGGYTPDISKVVEAHCNTALAALAVYC
ncbi:MAG: histone deacetylase [Terrimicrobiaceae bacterium]